MIPSKCHPEKSHYGLGYCFECYTRKSYLRRKKYFASRYKEKQKEIKEQQKEKRHRYKMIVLEYYSGTKIPECKCCREMNLEFLTIDHINGGGNEHRKTMRGQNFYSYLIKNNFPEGYRVLCMNCNWCRGKFGYCPHEKLNLI